MDFGVLALDARLKVAGDLTPFLLTREAGPVLLPACLDTLIQTNPTPDPDPEISIFLHGTSTAAVTDVQIVWRADLIPGEEKNWPEIVSVQPPRSSEAISVPLFTARAWLRKQRSADMADLEGLPGAEPREFAAAGSGKMACRWAGKEHTRIIAAKDVRPGDTIIVPAEYGGCDPFGWKPEDTTSVTDVGDFIARGRMIGLRLFGSRFDGLGSETIAAWRTFVRARETEEDSAANTALDELLGHLADDSLASRHSAPSLRCLDERRDDAPASSRIRAEFAQTTCYRSCYRKLSRRYLMRSRLSLSRRMKMMTARSRKAPSRSRHILQAWLRKLRISPSTAIFPRNSHMILRSRLVSTILERPIPGFKPCSTEETECRRCSL